METLPFEATQAASALKAVASPVASVMVVASPQNKLSPQVARSLARDFSQANLSESEGWAVKNKLRLVHNYVPRLT